MPTYIVLLGPPGAGKGTQAKRLSEVLGLVHVSSGELFRQHLRERTELGQVADGYIARGELVPDNVTIAMVRERLDRPDAARGAILDGFPRTPEQAEALDGILAKRGGGVDVVYLVDVPEDVLVRRLAGRWMCRAAGHVFHEDYHPPRRPGVCDVDGSELYQRDDDRPETVARRVQVYREQTAPLIEHYRKQGRLVEVNGAGAVEEVTRALLAALPQRQPGSSTAGQTGPRA